MVDASVYVRFTRTGRGTRLIATRGYLGPRIACLEWERKLTDREEHELEAAVRAGAASLGDVPAK